MKLTKILAAVAAFAFIFSVVPVLADTAAVVGTTETSSGTTVAVSTPSAAVVPVVSTGSALGTLFTLDRLYNGDPILGGYTSGTSLGNLFMLDQLFTGPYGGTANSLGTLFTLDQLFSGPYSNGLLNPVMTTLGDTFVLDQLFR